MTGFLDGVTSRNISSIRGWAIEDTQAPPLLASVNGAVVARFRPDAVRADLFTYPRQDLGFEISLPLPLKVGDVVAVTNQVGEHLTGSPLKITSIKPVTREDKALWVVRQDMKILEIGPAYNPLVPKAKGWNSFVLDHTCEEELRNKYRGPHPIERIEPVDYVWQNGPMESAVPVEQRGTFDLVVASHVIEHAPDPIAFLQSASVLLKKSGFLSLVIPDKRMMFDFFKPVTTTGDVLLAHRQLRTRHSRKTAFENIAYNVSEKNEIAWSIRPLADFNFFGEDVVAEAKRIFDSHSEEATSPYVDYHATIHTPSSFALILLELSTLGLLPFTTECSFPGSGCEFYITLRAGDPPKLDFRELNQQRLTLMKAAVRELSQQSRWLLDGEDY